MMKFPFTLASLILSAGFAVHAQPVFQDNFDAAEAGENLTTVGSTANWSVVGNRPFLGVVTDAEGLKGKQAMSLSKGMVYTTFDTVTLGVGDSLELSFRLRCTQDFPEKALPLRFGFFDDVEGRPDNGMAKGYWCFTSLGDQGVAVIARELGEDGNSGGGSDIPNIGPVFPQLKAGTVPNKIAMTITRGTDDSMDITIQFNDDAPVTHTDSDMKLAEFNAFGIRLSSEAPGQLLLDDFKAEVKRKGK